MRTLLEGTRCAACGGRAPEDLFAWRCACGGPWALEPAGATFPGDELARRPATMWRYREALAVRNSPVTLGEGMTPLLPSRDGRLWFKLESANPTGSFKDRGASLVVTLLAHRGVRELIEDSSGNAGAAIAAYSARAGIRATIYVPEATAPGKVTQVAAYGARVVSVPGAREDAARAAQEAGGLYASHAWQPAFFHGTKTVAFELWEQLGSRAPDCVVTPVGHGTLLLGLALGFRELCAHGAIARPPRFVATQSAGCAPLAGPLLGLPVGDGATVAEGIRVRQPVRRNEILAAVRESGGQWAVVSDAEILAAGAQLGREGLFVEPTAAVAPAAARQLLGRGQLADSEVVVVPLTGHGLKASRAAGSRA